MRIYKSGTKYNEVITQDMIQELYQSKENIILDGATGSGKTFFVENNLCEFAIKNNLHIMYISNRKGLKKQVINKTGNVDNIYVVSYQELEHRVRENKCKFKPDIIVADEFHYVLSDIPFNPYTDCSVKWIMNQEVFKVFMSGTGEYVFKLLVEAGQVKEENIFKIEYDYSYADLKVFNEHGYILRTIWSILSTTDDKIIYFSNSKKTAREVYVTFKEYATYFDANSKEEPIVNKELTSRLLVSTRALDNGIDIIDPKLKHIFCDIFDMESCQQSIGRKRLIDQRTDNCTFHIRNYDKKKIGNFKGCLMKTFAPLELFVKDYKQYYKKYGCNRRFHSDYIYPNEEGKLIVNDIAYAYMSLKKDEIVEMEEVGDSITLLLSKLGDTFNSVEYIPSEDNNDIWGDIGNETLEWLNAHRNIELKKPMQDELIALLDIRDKSNRQKKSISFINSHLNEFYNMSCISKQVKRKGVKMTVWKITKNG